MKVRLRSRLRSFASLRMTACLVRRVQRSVTDRTLASAGEDVDRQLVEALVGEALLHDDVLVEVMSQQRCCALFRVGADLWGSVRVRTDSLQYRPDFLVGVPASGLVFENQIIAHAA